MANVSLRYDNVGSVVADGLSNLFSDQLFDDSELGRGLGTLFSSGLGSVGNTVINNLVKGQTFSQGLAKNAGQSLAGAGVGIIASGIGAGLNALGGDTKLSRGISTGISTGLGTVSGQMVNNLFTKGINIWGKSKDITDKVKGINTLFKVGGTNGKNIFKSVAGSINPYAMGAQMVGSALSAGLGPSKEYEGKYGNITKTMDTIYDSGTSLVGLLPGIGQGISGIMALNKGLSNLFGSTSGMTSTDAILGSAFMPAPVKWLNMAGAKTTGTFNNQSWQNTEKTNAFMGNAFGNLGDKFDKAREEAGKTYGTFSQGAYNKAQNNIDFANTAWDKILAMADQNEVQNIRSQYMTSINNQRYAQNIQGGWSPLARGKQGMKILSNATNHNMAMRLLSGAALIDNKQMILCSAVD